MTKTKKNNGRKSETANVRKIVNSVLAQRTEMKYNTVGFTAAAPGLAGVVTPVTQLIVQGDQVNMRAGNVIFLHKLDFYLTAISGVNDAFRVILFVDKRNTGTIPAVGEVLQAAVPTSPYDILSTVNDRFTYLYDELIAMSTIGASTGSIARTVHRTIRKKVAYLGTTSVAAANGTNAIFVLLISDSAVSPAVAWDVGMHYTDM
jgi:hypothetical protein